MANITPFDLNEEIPIEQEFKKACHILTEKGFVARFGICTESGLPIMLNGSTAEITDPNYLCFYCNPTKASGLPELSKPHGEISLEDLKAMETLAHKKRLDACLVADATRRKAAFAEAYAMYETVLHASENTSVITTLSSIRKNNHSTKVTMLTAPGDLHKYSKEFRRIVSHCFAGISVCLLMGEHDPMLFFKASTAALSWEPCRPLELVAVLRQIMLLTARFSVGMRTLTSGAVLVQLDGFASLDALFSGENMLKLPGVYSKMNELVILPLVHRIGSPRMQENERALIPADRWEDALRTAMHLNERHAARLSGAIPDPRPNGPCITTHIADGHALERTCGRCGKWDRGDTRFKKCARCERTYYCSKECQVADWPGHRPTCCIKS